MNYPLVFGFLGIVSYILAAFMLVCLPWAHPFLGGVWEFEQRGVFGLLGSVAVCVSLGILFQCLGRNASEHFSKKDATAIVCLSWILATILGAMPYLFSGTERIQKVPMSVCDALFESQSGFSTTGATICGEVERPDLMPRCILFWRSLTHFLGGLGIMVLFVAILGQGSFGKAMMRFEWSGKSSPKERMQRLAIVLFKIYVTLNIVMTAALVVQGVSLFDSLCHSFGAVATGGLSTFNASIGHFAANHYTCTASIEWTITLFMFLGGTNFVLFYWVSLHKPERLFRDTEWRAYLGIILLATFVIVCFGIRNNDFDNFGTADTPIFQSVPPMHDPTLEQAEAEYDAEVFHVEESELTIKIIPKELPIAKEPREPMPVSMAVRTVMFQVVSLMTTTGYVTDEYEKWSGLSCGILLFLMFVGGCTGSTSGGFKVLRVVYVWKLLPLEIEKAYRPNVVRPLLIDGVPVDKDVVQRIFVHFTIMTVVFIFGTLFVLAFEPPSTWGVLHVAGDRKLVDTASAVASCMNNVGPGLGLIGARENFGGFSEMSKFLFTWLMLLGRLEFFVVLSLFHRGFWTGWKKPALKDSETSSDYWDSVILP